MYYYPYYQKNDRFLIPLIIGGIGGAAIAQSSRPRPVYVNPPVYPYPPYPNYNVYPYPY